MDEIFLEGLRFYAYHGVNPEERSLGQRFSVDIRLAVDLRRAGQTDNLDHTINYSAIYKRIRPIVEETPRDLIETVAEEIAQTILTEFATTNSVVVTVRKPDVPMKGAMLDAVGVTVRRQRAEMTKTDMTMTISGGQ